MEGRAASHLGHGLAGALGLEDVERVAGGRLLAARRGVLRVLERRRGVSTYREGYDHLRQRRGNHLRVLERLLLQPRLELLALRAQLLLLLGARPAVHGGVWVRGGWEGA